VLSIGVTKPAASGGKIVSKRGNFFVISQRIQELYDVNQTPKVAPGRVPVPVHILTPGMKPVQVTGFGELLARALSKDQIGDVAEASETFLAVTGAQAG
jgi:hypothetical protein